MPIIQIEGNDMPKEEKEKFFKEITETVSKYMNVPNQAVTIILNINPHDNICVGGELLSKRLGED